MKKKTATAIALIIALSIKITIAYFILNTGLEYWDKTKPILEQNFIAITYIALPVLLFTEKLISSILKYIIKNSSE